MTTPFSSRLEKTNDGSYTLKLEGCNEQYHSVHGALQESQHVFIDNGLKVVMAGNNPVSLLEVGLGTGLNALLSGREALLHKISIYYDAIEPYPISKNQADQLKYSRLFKEPWIPLLYDQIHKAPQQDYHSFGQYFHSRILLSTMEQVVLPAQNYNLVFFDAFGPETQPEMWTQQVFEKVFHSMKNNAVLVTYCAKGAVRRAMKNAGFDVEKLPGPPGKREMTRAMKISQ